ncbi:unnamed protein product, partial [Musa acuminata subsp. burmannicoides]
MTSTSLHSAAQRGEGSRRKVAPGYFSSKTILESRTREFDLLAKGTSFLGLPPTVPKCVTKIG